MVTLPALIPVTFPDLSTVATLPSSDVHIWGYWQKKLSFELPGSWTVSPTATSLLPVIASVEVPPKTLSMILVMMLSAFAVFSPSSVEGAGVEGSAASVLAEPTTASAVTTMVAPSATLSAATVYSPALGVSVVSPLASASLTAAAPSVKPSAAFAVNFTSLSAGTTSSVAASLPL